MTVDDRGEGGGLAYLVRPDDVISGQPLTTPKFIRPKGCFMQADHPPMSNRLLLSSSVIVVHSELASIQTRLINEYIQRKMKKVVLKCIINRQVEYATI